MIRFLHAADFHLDSPFGALTPDQGAQRRQEGRALMMELAHYVNDHEISLVLLAGDLFESNRPYGQTVTDLSQALGTMQAQVCIAPGNHDFCDAGSPYVTQTWPDNVHIFKKNRLETLSFPQWNLTDSGAGFVAPEQTRSMRSGPTMPHEERLHIGVFHSELQAATPHSHPIGQKDIEASGFHYLALGHIHKRCLPATIGKTVVAWPGCLEGRGFDELGEKGFYAGALSPKGEVKTTFVPFARRMHQTLTVDVTGQDPLGAIESQLPPDTAPHLYRIVLEGNPPEAGIDLGALQSALAPRFFHLELREHTKVAQNIWARSQEDSLSGLFLRNLQQALTQTTDEKTIQTITLATRYGLAALEHQDLDALGQSLG